MNKIFSAENIYLFYEKRWILDKLKIYIYIFVKKKNENEVYLF